MALTIDSREVNLAADLYRRADKQLRKEFNKAASSQGNPWLRHAIRRNAKGPQDVKIANTARLRNGQRPGVVVGGSGRIGREPIRNLVREYEFGADREYRVRYASTSEKGKRYPVTRHTQRQLPWRRPNGRFVYPAVAEVAPQVVSMWLAILMDTYEGATRG